MVISNGVGFVFRAKDVSRELPFFINSLIVNPSFDSQTKETLTTNQRDFGSKFTLSGGNIDNN